MRPSSFFRAIGGAIEVNSPLRYQIPYAAAWKNPQPPKPISQMPRRGQRWTSFVLSQQAPMEERIAATRRFVEEKNALLIKFHGKSALQRINAERKALSMEPFIAPEIVPNIESAKLILEKEAQYKTQDANLEPEWIKWFSKHENDVAYFVEWAQKVIKQTKPKKEKS